MPEKLIDSFTMENLQPAAKYHPGYDWIPGYFGPPLGIPEAKKSEFDRMNDKEYLYAFLRLSQEQKESLMISEAERRRTFNAHWPIQHVVKGNDLAKEGFYYTGIADKVQCAFCCGIIRNWEIGDHPAQSHRAYFPYCKMVQKKPSFNIPFDETDSWKALGTEKLFMQRKIDSYNNMNDKENMYAFLRLSQEEKESLMRSEAERRRTFNAHWPIQHVVRGNDLAKEGFSYTDGKEFDFNACKPANIKYALLHTRLETFKGYSSSNPIPPHELASAGFYLTGPPDKVKCFSCDGELHNWAVGDDTWVEHAKWFPSCTFVREQKGIDFIYHVKSMKIKDDLEIWLPTTPTGLSNNMRSDREQGQNVRMPNQGMSSEYATHPQQPNYGSIINHGTVNIYMSGNDSSSSVRSSVQPKHELRYDMVQASGDVDHQP